MKWRYGEPTWAPLLLKGGSNEFLHDYVKHGLRTYKWMDESDWMDGDKGGFVLFCSFGRREISGTGMSSYVIATADISRRVKTWSSYDKIISIESRKWIKFWAWN